MKNNYLPKILSILKDLEKSYPTLSVARHISDAASEYGELLWLSNKELLDALEVYKEQLLMNQPPTEDEIAQITREAMDLSSILDEEEEEY